MRDAEAADDAGNGAGRGGALPPDAHDERREVARHRQRERPADHGENVAPVWSPPSPPRATATTSKQDAGHGQSGVTVGAFGSIIL